MVRIYGYFPMLRESQQLRAGLLSGGQQQVLAKGWGYALITPGSIQADNGAGLTAGIIGLVNKGQPRKPDDWGALRAWAWGERSTLAVNMPVRVKSSLYTASPRASLKPSTFSTLWPTALRELRSLTTHLPVRFSGSQPRSGPLPGVLCNLCIDRGFRSGLHVNCAP